VEDLVILVPMLGRPHRVAPLLESITETVPEARVLFLVSPADHAVHAEIDRAGRERLTVPYHRHGDYARKINTGYRHTTEALLFTAADDLRFHDGWFERAASKLARGVGVVGTNDLGSPRVKRGEHATHFLVTREYADRLGTIDGPGAIFCEIYPHEFVDDELVGTAKRRGAWVMALASHVEHLHPNWGKAPTDGLYMQQSTRMRIGRTIYQQRRHLWE
jgi:hypothetical protein